MMRGFWRNECGAVAVYFALMAPVLIGFTALGAEAGLWLMTQRKLQHVADTVAYSTAIRALTLTNSTEVTAFARARAAEMGVASSELTVTQLSQGRVKIDVTRPMRRYLSAIFPSSRKTWQSTVTAVAGLLPNSGDRVCMVALSQTASPALSIGGSGELTMVDCSAGSNSIASNSFQVIGGAARLTADCVYTVGGYTGSTTGLNLECGSVQTVQRPTADPYADLYMPTASDLSGLMPQTIANNATEVPADQRLTRYPTLPVAYFRGGVSFNQSLTLRPGLYIVDGGTMRVSANTTLSGTGVSFYLTNGAQLQVSGTAELRITAYDPAHPTLRTDPYAGFLFFADRTGASVSHSFQGNATNSVNGIMYFPNDSLDFSGASTDMSPCVRVLSSVLSVTGNSRVNLACAPSVPVGTPLPETAQRIALLQ